jgi:hypothetical protein
MHQKAISRKGRALLEIRKQYLRDFLASRAHTQRYTITTASHDYPDSVPDRRVITFIGMFPLHDLFIPIVSMASNHRITPLAHLPPTSPLSFHHTLFP